MAELTAAEKKWVSDVQKVLNRCPSKRLGFATAGDRDITIYDNAFSQAIEDHIFSNGTGDFIPTAERLGAVLGEVTFPANVESTAA
ncbi:hypothetical protein [Serratia marcescens]|uniref:hypothetical protein n=1 Tax=Serratia marcescens TaxID=615 RepID=UPI001151DE70|nr:hypothetical protein [Serratia marcescens]MDU3932880.1 hypothetical protein [Serratia liquefaciens]QDI42592.1 hypothetical protein FG172_10545 [Serratia marcescens]QDI57021.1 hypothetical protein FG175_10545 [Serratia marcescens]